MRASSTMRSARHISWIWKRTVSRFSKRKDRCPSSTRRRRFSAITAWRRSFRTFSYSKRFNTSWRAIIGLVMTSLLDGETVSLGEEPDRMPRRAPGPLMDLQRSQGTVGRHPVGSCRLDLLEERLRDLHGQLEVLLLHSPRAVDGRAALDGVDTRAGEPQHIGRLRAQVLRLQMARKLVGDGARRIGEMRIQPTRRMKRSQVLEQV